MTNGKEYLKLRMDGISKIDDHFTCWRKRERREKRETKKKREEIELISPVGESSKIDFSYFNILPQADPEALDVIILAGMPGLE